MLLSSRCQWKIVFLTFWMNFYIVQPTQRSAAFTVLKKDHRLKDFLIMEKEVENHLDCAHICLAQRFPLCKSVNYRKKKKNGKMKCQVNNETSATKPENLVPDTVFDYWEKVDARYCIEEHQEMVKDCADLYKQGYTADGEYNINPDGCESFPVRCDMKTDGGGWTIFQRRVDGSVDFYRGWQDYKNGFGDMKGEFWLGLDKIHGLTTSTKNVLRVDMEDTSGNTRYAVYDYFALLGESNQYQLALENYTGTAGDSLTHHNGRPFQTKDHQDDNLCAVRFKGAWWYKNCHVSNLNGLYLNGAHSSFANGVNWKNWKDYHYSLKKTEMKFRPFNF